LPAVALNTDSSILTAVGNDYGFDQILARQVQALGGRRGRGDRFSTRENSPNVIGAVKQAAQQDFKTIRLTRKDGGSLAKAVDISIIIASTNVARAGMPHHHRHILCELVENDLS